MRLRRITLTLTLIVLASGVFAAPALAGDPSITDLKQRLRHARHLRHRAHDRLAAATADLSAARAFVATTTPTPAPTPEPAPSPAVTPDAAPSPAVTPDATASPGVDPDPAATPAATPTAVPVPILTLMRQDVAVALLEDGIITSEELRSLEARLMAAKRAARRCDLRVRRLQRRLERLRQIAAWNRAGRWRPLIAIAAAKYGVSAGGLYRMMMLESGGSRTAGTTYKGLFQYYPSTWSGSWNPWRHESVYNGWAQIRATAYAIGRGMGPSQWPNTYPMAF